VYRSLHFNRYMSVPTFVDLQGFTLKRARGFVVKEFAALREGNILAHYIFTDPWSWDLLLKSERSCASWLTACHHGLRWENGIVPYWRARQLITTAVLGAENASVKDIVYVKGHEKREWLKDLILDDQQDCAYIETLDADYEDVDSLKNLSPTNTMRCGQHNRLYGQNVKICALQNVFKLYNWWLQHQKGF
jgi:hypothetical protein